MKTNAFGYTEGVVQRLMREERERADLYRSVMSGGAAEDMVRQATEHQKLLRGLEFLEPPSAVAELLVRERRNQEALSRLTTTAWALSVQETARSIAERHGGLVEQQRQLATTASETLRVLDINRSTMAAALAATGVGESYRRIVADMLPHLSAYGAIAERMLMVDAMTLRASAEVAESATAFAARTVIDARQIAEAMAEAETVEEGARLHGSLIDLLIELFRGLGPNTIPELQKMGLAGFLNSIVGVLGLVLGIYALMPEQARQSPEDKAAFAEMGQKLDRLQEEADRYRAAEVRTEEAFVSDLPRAVLRRDGTFRRTPDRAGDVVLKVEKGAEVAVAEARGRWRAVVYRDPLSNQLARAWVYANALTPLAAPVLEGGRASADLPSSP